MKKWGGVPRQELLAVWGVRKHELNRQGRPLDLGFLLLLFGGFGVVDRQAVAFDLLDGVLRLLLPLLDTRLELEWREE